MKLRNLMIVVDDCAAAKEYYVNVFGLAVVTEVENKCYSYRRSCFTE